MKKKILLLAIFIAVTLSLSAQSAFTYQEGFGWNSPKVMAMGGAAVANVEGFDSFQTNPAGFRTDEGEFSIVINADMAANPFDLFSGLTSTSFDYMAFFVDQMVNNGLGAGADLQIAYAGKGLGIGLFINTDLMFPQVSNPLTASGTVIADGILVAGYTWRIYLSENKEFTLDLGFDVRGGIRYALDVGFSDVFSIVGGGFNLNSLTMLAGWSISGDLGAKLSYKSLNVGLALRDFPNTYYNYTEGPMMTALAFGGTAPSVQYVTPMSLDVGVGWDPDLGDIEWLIDFNAELAFDIPILFGVGGDQLNGWQKQSFWAHTHLGLEATLLTVLDIRAGLNSGYITAGFGLDIYIGEINFAIYSQENGRRAGQEQELGAALEVAIRF